MNKCIATRYNDSNGNSRVPSPSPSVSRPVSLTVPSLLGKDSGSLCHGSAGSLVEAVSVCHFVCIQVELKQSSVERIFCFSLTSCPLSVTVPCGTAQYPSEPLDLTCVSAADHTLTLWMVLCCLVVLRTIRALCHFFVQVRNRPISSA